MRQELKNLLWRVERWPTAAQRMAVASLEKIEDEMVTIANLSDDDRGALERSAKDVTERRFLSETAASDVFRRFRRT